VDGRGSDVVSGRGVPLFHVHVRLLARPRRPVRETDGAAVREHRRVGPGHRTPGAHVQPVLRFVPRSPVRRVVPDAQAAPDDLRSGAGEPRADRRLCALHRPRHVRGQPGREPAVQRAVQHERRPVEDHAAKAESRVHIRKAEAHARTGGRVQRAADAQRGRGRSGRWWPDGDPRRARQVLDRRHRHVRVRTAAERHQRRAVLVPQVRQGRVRAVDPRADQRTGLDGDAGATTRAPHQRRPAGRRPVLHRRVHRHDEVPGGTRHRQGRRHAVPDPGQDRPGRQQDRTVRYDSIMLTKMSVGSKYYAIYYRYYSTVMARTRLMSHMQLLSKSRVALDTKLRLLRVK